MTPPTPAAPINAPHPDDDDPAAFFGDEDPQEGAAPSLMPEEDEGAAPTPPKPVSGEALEGQTFSEDGETIAEVPPTDAAERAKWEAKQVAQAEAAEATEDLDEEEDVQRDPAPAKSAETTADGSPAAAQDAGETPAPASVKSGPRSYVVIREIELTSQYIDHFAKALEEGKPPHKIYMVLESREARSPNPVLTGAFKKHMKRLGQPLRLAAIPMSYWNLKTLSLKPKVVDDNIEIED